MHMLLANTSGISDLRVGHVRAHGYDAVAYAQGCKYLPDGEIRFEFSVRADSRRKAEEDFQNRSSDDDAANVTFVYATPRRWPQGNRWVQEKEAEGIFARVRVLDGHALFQWLEEIPAVHIRLSEQLGQSPFERKTLTQWWADFQNSLILKIPAELFLAGRQDQQSEIRHLLQDAVSHSYPHTLVGQSDFEALAFLYATIQKDASILQRTIIIESQTVFRQMELEEDPLILIPTFEGAERLVSKRHVLLHAIGRQQAGSNNVRSIELPALPRFEAMDALSKIEPEPPNADYLACLARENFELLRCELAIVPRALEFDWLTGSQQRRLLAQLLLFRAWMPGTDDDIVVELITGLSNTELTAQIDALSRALHPPISNQRANWSIVQSRALVRDLGLLIREISESTWLEAIENTLFSRAAVRMPELLRGIPSRSAGDGSDGSYSETLQTGMVESLALISIELMDGSWTVPGNIVSSILQRAFGSSEAEELQKASSFLPGLAEAAPDVYLETLATEIAAPSTVLMRMLSEENEVTYGLRGILDSLEVLSWSTEYVSWVIDVLGELYAHARAAPVGGEVLTSMSKLLDGRLPFSALPSALKQETIRNVINNAGLDDDLIWQFLLALLAPRGGITTLPARPKFRSWNFLAPNDVTANLQAMAAFLLHHCLEYVQAKPERWVELAPAIIVLPPVLQTKLLAALDSESVQDSMSDATRFTVWHFLERFHHRLKNLQQEEVPERAGLLAVLGRVRSNLLDAEDPRRHGPLFDGWGDLTLESCDATDAASDAYEKRMTILEQLQKRGLDAIEALAVSMESPHYLGAYLAALKTPLQHDYLRWLTSDNVALRVLAERFVEVRAENCGVIWLRDVWEDEEFAANAYRLSLARRSPNTREFWEFFDDIGEPYDLAYWEDEDRDFWVKEGDRAVVAEILFSNGYPMRSVRMFGQLCASRPDSDGGNLIEACQRALLSLREEIKEGYRLDMNDGHYISNVLAYLHKEEPGSESFLQLELFFYQFLPDNKRSQALQEYFTEQPIRFQELLVEDRRGGPACDWLEDINLKFTVSQIIAGWEFLPGVSEVEIVDEETSPNRTVDEGVLSDWINSVREDVRDSDALQYIDTCIGKLLGGGPDWDEFMPLFTAVANVLQSVRSAALEQGLRSRLHARYEVHVRPFGAAGKPEREVAQVFREFSGQLSPASGRMKRVLRNLVSDFERAASERDGGG